MPTMINTAVAAAASNNIDARSYCGMAVILEEAVTIIGRVGLTLVSMPCKISFVAAVLVDFGTTIVFQQPGHSICIPAVSRSYIIC